MNLAIYDRQPSLTEAEQAELETLIGRRVLPSIPRFYNYSGLHRLFVPLRTTLHAMGADTQSRHGVLAVVAEEMLRRNQSFWAWTANDWQDILTIGGKSFRDKYRTHNKARYYLMAVAYLICGLEVLPKSRTEYQLLAEHLFGRQAVDAALQPILEVERSWGYTKRSHYVAGALCAALLASGSPRLEHITIDLLERVRSGDFSTHIQRDVIPISRALVHLGYLDEPLPVHTRLGERWLRPDWHEEELTDGIALEWVEECQRWLNTSTMVTRRTYYILCLKVGRWLAETHPEIVRMKQWTRDLCAEYVAAVSHMTFGQWKSEASKLNAAKIGKPSAPRSKALQLAAIRTLFRDAQEWNWIPRRFDPRRTFGEPRSLKALIGTNPRIISEDVWVKLVWAGTNLAAEDLLANDDNHANRTPRSYYYPVEMVRAVAVTWLFAGLRTNEIARLRVGCVRWQREDVPIAASGDVLAKDAVCFLDVPTHKTGKAFTKPVDPLVGKAIAEWERVRPKQPMQIDRKTAEEVEFLFSSRGYRLATNYVTKGLIPLLCRKANIDTEDARGKLTSHRARSTIATLLFNAAHPMGLFELQEWLGHSSPHSTQHYAKVTPTRLAKSYADADYFARTTRMMAVLIDRDAVTSGKAGTGEPWMYYDLGHGYCTNAFFARCPHRMACAKCNFYVPKESGIAQIVEAKANLQKMREVIELTDDEAAAVDGDTQAYDKLLSALQDVPTPAGPTPREYSARGRPLPVLPSTKPAESLRRDRS